MRYFVFEDIASQEVSYVKVRVELLHEIREYIRKTGVKQKDAALPGIPPYYHFKGNL